MSIFSWPRHSRKEKKKRKENDIAAQKFRVYI